ncbi:MAG: CHRD domain-containing protein [Planctomycetes bacterium]|nr:CHRD domain-containing protein [Planctomycetota bacterium]
MIQFPTRILISAFALAPVALAQDQALEQASPATHASAKSVVPPTPQLPPSPSTSSPGTVAVLFTNIATSPTSDVPGAPLGTKFTSGSGSTNFDKPWVSANGLHWAIRADTPLATSEDSVLMVDGTLFMREGTPTPFNPLTNWGQTDIRVGIADNGDLALFTNTTETANDDYVLKYTAAGGTWTIIAQEGAGIPALAGVTYDDDLDSISLLADGRVAFRANGIDGTGITAALNDEILIIGAALDTQTSVTIPTGQAGGATDSWQNLTFENIWVSLDGLHVLIDGDTDAATTVDDVTTYDNAVVIQEGQPLAGTGFTSPVVSGGPDEVAMDAAGRWYARGNNADGEDWVLRNGVVIAKTDNPLALSGDRVFLSAIINEAQETPPSGSTATGSARFLLNTVTNELHYDITLSGLVGETAAHLHGFAGPGVPAGVLYALPIGNQKDGVINYLESEEPSILAGLTYVNIHTGAFPGGEIRGQVVVDVESWDDADFADGFFAMAGNAAGDYVVGGLTSAPSSVNGVIVMNNSIVLLREGDPVDVNGNGLFDDDAYYNTFGNDDCVLLEDGSLYFTATLKNGAGTAFAQGVFLRRANNFQSSFCYGDGAGTACPCGNVSIVGQTAGCVNSFGLAGRLDSSGLASVSGDSLVLTGTQVPNGPGLYFQGTGSFGGGNGIPFGDGLLCAGGTIIRMGVVFAAGNTSSYPGGTTPGPINVVGFNAAGDSRTYQLWYRDGDPGFCTVSTFNLTNAVRVVWSL